MSPDAIRYYLHWLSCRGSPWRFYSAFMGISVLALILLGHLGTEKTSDVGSARQVAYGVLAFLISALLAATAYFGTRLGSWILLTRLESEGDEHFRRVWHALMTRHRGLRPDVVDSERFRRLLLRVSEQIVRHEELTPQQQQWMDQLRRLAIEPPKRPGRTLTSKIATRHGERIMVWAPILVIVWSLILGLLLLLGA